MRASENYASKRLLNISPQWSFQLLENQIFTGKRLINLKSDQEVHVESGPQQTFSFLLF